MPFTQQLLLNIPTVPLAFVIVGASVVLTMLTAWLSSYIVPKDTVDKGNRFSGMIFGANAIIYCILLSVVLLIAWLGFQGSQMDVQKEADCIVELYRNTEAFLPSMKQEIHGLLEEYTKSVIDEEWKTLARSEPNPHTIAVSKKIWKAFASYVPRDATEQVFLQESIRKLYELRESRAVRMQDSKIGVYPILWCILLVGEVVTVFSLSLFSSDFKFRLLMAVLFGVLVGLIYYTILLFDFPYTGEFIVSSFPLRSVLLYW